ncbi:MAG: transglycosylase domain-containing protein, partial [Pigmentiphaga sp.]
RYWRKAQELVLAWMLEAIMSKQRILALSLTIADWGNGVFGAEAAARHHFQRGAGQLNNRQAAQLAARLPNPRFYDTRGVTSYLNSRTNTIAARLRHAEIP